MVIRQNRSIAESGNCLTQENRQKISKLSIFRMLFFRCIFFRSWTLLFYLNKCTFIKCYERSVFECKTKKTTVHTNLRSAEWTEGPYKPQNKKECTNQVIEPVKESQLRAKIIINTLMLCRTPNKPQDFSKSVQSMRFHPAFAIKLRFWIFIYINFFWLPVSLPCVCMFLCLCCCCFRFALLSLEMRFAA